MDSIRLLSVRPFGWRNSMPGLRLRGPEPRTESRGLLPVSRKGLRQTGRARHERAGALDSPAQVAQPPLRGALLRLPRVVREAARDLEEAEPPRRGRDEFILRVLVRGRQRTTRLEAPPRAVVAAAREGAGGYGDRGGTRTAGAFPTLWREGVDKYGLTVEMLVPKTWPKSPRPTLRSLPTWDWRASSSPSDFR